MRRENIATLFVQRHRVHVLRRNDQCSTGPYTFVFGTFFFGRCRRILACSASLLVARSSEVNGNPRSHTDRFDFATPVAAAISFRDSLDCTRRSIQRCLVASLARRPRTVLLHAPDRPKNNRAPCAGPGRSFPPSALAARYSPAHSEPTNATRIAALRKFAHTGIRPLRSRILALVRLYHGS